MNEFMRLYPLATAIALLACSPKVGKECTAGKDLCSDDKTALHCGPSAKYTEVACRGPLGCIAANGKANCDTSQANAGDPCMGATDEYACSKTQELLCSGGTFVRQFECRGPKGCTITGRTVSCDNTLAERGDPCKRMGSLACSVDNKQRFVCKDGKWDLDSYCRGNDGCQVRLNDMFCDNSLSEVDDPCRISNTVVCSADGSRRLICKNGRFAEDAVCKSACKVGKDHGISCN
jgi:hypothetical protein